MVSSAQNETVSSVNPLFRASSWLYKKYWLGIVPAVILLLFRSFVPEYLPNEAVRLVSLRQFIDPSFLSQEWLHLAGYDEDRLTFGFKLLFAPLWLCTSQGVLIALLGRLVVWAILFYSILRLARALNIPRYALAWGLPLWLCHQTFGAGEFVFGGLEGKCLAYAGIFLAIEALLSGRLMRAAVFIGLNFWFHVPVGLWGGLAVCASLLSQPNLSKRRLFYFAAVAIGLCLPMIWIALQYAGGMGLVGAHPEADWLVVVFRNPHHLDPAYFHGWPELLRLAICAGVAIAGLSALVSRSHLKLLACFLLMLLLEFGAGLLAWQFGLLWYLKTYPFRVADVLVPFLFFLVLPAFVVNLRHWADKTKYFTHVNAAGKNLASAVVIVAFAVWSLAFFVRSNRLVPYQFDTSWVSYLHHKDTPLSEMTRWVKINTPGRAVIIAPPWLTSFSLDSERAEVVVSNRNPHNDLIVEWYRRYIALNGGPFHSMGADANSEMESDFPRLSSSQLDAIRKQFGGEYYLTTIKRSDLGTAPIHEDGEYFLYKLTR